MTAPATMQNEMRWGSPHPRSGKGGSGAHD